MRRMQEVHHLNAILSYVREMCPPEQQEIPKGGRILERLLKTITESNIEEVLWRCGPWLTPRLVCALQEKHSSHPVWRKWIFRAHVCMELRDFWFGTGVFEWYNHFHRETLQLPRPRPSRVWIGSH